MALSTQARASTATPLPWKYDVFLSFRGTDTRKGFTDYLYKELQRQGIKTFRDDPRLERGTAISLELLTAIKQSRFAIIVLSPNYATSTWCLLELSTIVGCMEERGSILPVFYEVVPSDVRHQRGSFAEAFEEHEEKLGEDNEEVEGWREALTKVASLAGWSSKDYRYETELIREIVQALWSKVHPSFSVFGSSEKLVGMDTKLEEIDVLLDREANDVRFIGIWGMGGLGKTTLARLVYEKISHQFEVCIFLANVREVSATSGGLEYLQKQILSQILKEEHVQEWDVYRVITVIKRCFCTNAVLLVLDDVDQSEQLENLAGEKDGFGSRSRVIITTRDRHVLVAHGVEKPYELKGLDNNDAFELFSWKAFRKNEPEKDYVDYSKSFVMYAGGLPLALKTLGCFLYKRSPDSWSSALQKLQQTPNRTVFEILKINFDGLDEMEKKVFLDIACFRRLYRNESMIELVCSSDCCSRIAIDVLVEKSLLTISSDNRVVMHDLIQEMGCEIVRQENEEPGERSRLWLRNDIFHVFTKNKGTEAIEGILLHLDKLEEADWNLEAFSNMCKLKLLHIHNLRLSFGPKHLPNALRFLNWSWYPSKSLPPGFQPNDLTELGLLHSNIDHLWNGIKDLCKLKSIDLSYSKNLTRTPDFTGIPNLEKLVLEGCTNLVKIHPSIALLKRLKIWNFRNCKSIRTLPSEVNMECLETFDVSGCSKLKMIPKFIGQLKRLSKLCLDGTAVENLHPLIEHLRGSLVELDLSGIVTTKQNLLVSWFGFFQKRSPHPVIPVLASSKHLSSLVILKLNDCMLCEGEMPNDVGSLSCLTELELSGNNFVTLPASIHLLSKLRRFRVTNCKRLRQLPDLPASDFLYVMAADCTSLQVFPDPTDLCRKSEFSFGAMNCSSLVRDQHSSYFYSLLRQMLEVQQETSALSWGSFVIPGSEIPQWFSDLSVGNSVTEKLPSDASNSGKWIGVAVCALVVAQGITEERCIYHRCCISCSNNTFGDFRRKWCYDLVEGEEMVSDHLFLDVLPRHLWEPQNSQPKDTCNYAKFVFDTSHSTPDVREKCLKVEKCGARVLYEHDLEELISKIKQFKTSVSVYEEAMDEQENVTVKATRAITSESGDSDYEYYSAEE